jgi:SH3-like domain-containing protein
MIRARGFFLAVMMMAAPAAAQTSVQTAPATPTAPAPNPPRKHKPAHPAKPTPVVQAPANSHAQRPATSPPAAPPATPAIAPPPAPPSEDKGTVTGLKLPRWAALRADEVNLRVGPGTRFPIEWQYHRRDLPVRILREVEVWRLVEDQDGVKGWVHQATLIGRRSFAVKGNEAVLRATASDDAAPVARLKPGVIGRIRACAAGAAWCEVQVEDYRGWLKRSQFWGSDSDEAIGN